MQKYFREATLKAPQMSFDPQSGLMEISGRSIPENAHELYESALSWVKQYVKQPAPRTELSLNLAYFNSSSTQYIYDIMSCLDLLYKQGKEANIIWFFDRDDEDMEMIGQDFKKMLSVPIIMIVQEGDS